MKRYLWLFSIILILAILLISPVQVNATTELNLNEIANINGELSFWEIFPTYLWLIFGIIAGVIIMLVIFFIFTSPKRKGVSPGAKTKQDKTGSMPAPAVSGQPIAPQPAQSQPLPRSMPPQTIEASPTATQPLSPSTPQNTNLPSTQPVQAQPVPDTTPPQTQDKKPEAPQPSQTKEQLKPDQTTAPQAADTEHPAPQPAEAQIMPRTMPPQTPDARPVPAQPVQAQPVSGITPAQAPAPIPATPQPAQAQVLPRTMPPQPQGARPPMPQQAKPQPVSRPMAAQAATPRPVPTQAAQAQPIRPNVISLQQPAPAAPRFSVRNLVITPNQVKDGDTVNISATVVNMGTASGEHSMELRIGGVVEEVLKASLDPGSSEIVNSTISRDKPGNYTVELDRLRGGFAVTQRRPASFSVNNLVISPEKVKQGESVVVSAIVTNSGETEGTYSAVLRIKDITESVEDVTLPPGGNQRITFNITKEAAGFYPLSLDGLKGRFVVEMDWTG